MIGIFINLWNRLTGGGTPAPTPALLDTYGGAAAAFSLRKLSSTYGGSAVRVRRSLDNTEQDIGFSGDNLDEAALQAFVGYENLLTYSEQFENAAWSKFTSTITPNAGTDPFGGNNAERWLSNVGSTTHSIAQTLTLTNGQSYTISFWVRSNTGSNQSFRLFGNSTIASPDLTATTSWQRFTFTFLAGSGPFAHGLARPTTDAAVDLLIFGAQLNQGVTAQNYQQTIATANTANGFVTRWYTQDGNGENLILQSQTFENAYWNKFNAAVVADNTVAPDGTTTADKLNETAVNGYHSIFSQTISTPSGSTVYSCSYYLKAAERSFALVGFYYESAPTYDGFSIVVDLSNGSFTTQVTGTSTISSFSVTSVGNGWYRCFISGSTGQTGIHRSNVHVMASSTFAPYLGVVGSGIYIWGSQLSQSSWLQGYQATTTTAVSRRDASQATAASQPRIVNAGVIERENGKPAIRFDGVDDFIFRDPFGFPTTNISISKVGSRVSSGINYDFLGYLTTGGGFVNINSSLRLSFDGRPISAYISAVAPVAPTTSPVVQFNVYDGAALKASANGSDFGSTAVVVNPIAYGNQRLDIGGSPILPLYSTGLTQEFIMWGTNRSANKDGISSITNSFYQLYWQGTQQALLDQFGGSAAAFSLRNLSSSYRGPLVRVRRSTDNAETDIGGTFGGDLDVNSLLAFTGGQNLVLYSEDYTQTNWVKTGTTATANATIAPDGTLTADKLAETAVTSQHAFGQSYTISTAGPHTISFYIKAAERSIAGLAFYLNSGTFDGFGITVDLSNGSYFTGSSGNSVIHTQSVVNVGNGWWRISVSGNTTRTGIHIVQVATSTGTLASPVSTYLGVAGSGVYIWGAQLNTGILQPYIPTTTAAINGANAFVTKWYDQSGIGDNLVLQSETFGNASWTKSQCTVSENVAVDPFGGNNADKILENGLAAQGPYIFQNISLVAGTTYVFSCYMKAAERNFGAIDLFFNSVNNAVLVDLTSGAVVVSINNPITTVENAGNGWWRVAVFLTPSINGSVAFTLSMRATASFASYNTTLNSGILIYGAQVSASSQLLRYQPTTTAIAPKRDAIQTTAASQPRIVNAGSVESENGKPALFWTDGSGMRLVSSFSPIAMPQSFFTVSKLAAVSGIGAAMVFDSYDNVANAYYFTGNTDTPNNILRYISGSSLVVDALPIVEQSLVSIQHDTTTNVYYDSRLNVSGNAGVSTLSGLSIGNVRGNPTVLAPAYEWFGSIQELTVYPTNQSLRTSVESNINTYYQIYWQGNGTALLDSYSGASAAYSLRNLSSAYTGPLIRVRRSSDNVERDIYGTFRGDLDLAALTSFVGANSGFVTTWYDQSGTGRHATQATAASQPRIVNAGAVDTENGKPAMFFDGSNDFFSITNGLNTLQDVGYVNMFSVVTNNPAAAVFKVIAFFSDPSGSTRFNNYINGSVYRTDARRVDSGIGGLSASVGGSISINAQALLYSAIQYLTSDGFQYVNGVIDGSNTSFLTDGNTSNTPSSLATIGGVSSSLVFNGEMQEIILYTTNQLPSRLPIESNINNYYKIY
jgi:hypothetical protein